MNVLAHGIITKTITEAWQRFELMNIGNQLVPICHHCELLYTLDQIFMLYLSLLINKDDLSINNANPTRQLLKERKLRKFGLKMVSTIIFYWLCH